MGVESSKALFGGKLADFYSDNEAQPIPLIINVCLKYLAHAKLYKPLELAGLEKALVSVGFANDDDNPDGIGAAISRTNSAASPAVRTIRRSSKTMSMVRPTKELRAVVRMTKKALNQDRIWALLELLHPSALEKAKVVPPKQLEALKNRPDPPSVAESTRLIMLVLCDFLKELGEPLWNEEFTRLFNECIIDDNQKRMFQLYSVQQTAHKIMSDALMSSLHEFWMKNNDFVTSDMLSTIFGPSCAQTKLISDPKGPVVYLHAEAGETATRVFQYILERSALFIHELHPDDDVPETIIVHDEEATRKLHETQDRLRRESQAAAAREQFLKDQAERDIADAAEAQRRYRDKIVKMWRSYKIQKGPEARAVFQAWAHLARQSYRQKMTALLVECRDELNHASQQRDDFREEVESLQAELASKNEREQRWLQEKKEMEEIFLQQREVLKKNPGHYQPRGHHQPHGHRPQTHHDTNTTGTDRDPSGRSGFSKPFFNYGPGSVRTGPPGRRHPGSTRAGATPGSWSHPGNVHGPEHSNEMSDTELIARLRLHDREIYKQVQRRYFHGEAGAAGVTFAANLSRHAQPSALNSYYWPVQRDRA